MAQSQQSKRLSPSLTYVFRQAHKARDAGAGASGSEGGLRSGALRATQRAIINEADLRRDVAQDVETLLNCISLESALNLHDFPHVRESALNYGFPSIASRTMDELERSGLESEIERVLRTFEPRLIASSLRVQRDRRVDAVELKIRYVVQADLACEPVALPIEFVADVEVTTGKIQIKTR
ncbi:type VI secretion system baseplate subunit TssE [Methylocystis heyeri]|uniref:type VI secretion system baseplate subunit TssE n=1 Tax=Methylocystis heyeri TaxID=391905 RepID=UPI00113BF4AB|nr:GPW/gp25 family protein [Methylocystis heyeri]